jgi:MSHA pilin protein MshA
MNKEKIVKRQAGFTLIELILVIVVLGILAVSALPSFYDVTTNARNSARDGVAGAINAGLATYRSNALINGTSTALADLSSAHAGGDCTVAAPCFLDVLDQGVNDDDWTKTNATTYVYNGTATFTYTAPTANSAGSFVCTAGC